MIGRIATPLVLLCCLASSPAAAAGQLIDDIRVVRRGDEATVTIALGCRMRLQSDAASDAGASLEIRVVPTDACRRLGLGSGLSSEAYRPVGGQLAHLEQVEFESLGIGDGLLLLHFDRAIAYRVTQRGNLESLQVKVAASAAVSASTAPADTVSATRTAEPIRAQPSIPAGDRHPLSVRISAPETVADYIINLQSAREVPDAGVVETVPVPGERRLYVSEMTINGETWYRLRIGFFDDEAAARAALAPLSERFPRAWIGRAEPDEVASAADHEFAPGSVIHASAPVDEVAAPAAPEMSTDPADPEQIAAWLAEAREQLLSGRLDDAIASYTRLLQEPGPHRPEAREYLGIAREKNGQLSHARAEYEAYLRDYPSSGEGSSGEGSAEGARRVQQRLSGLTLAAEPPRERLRAASSASGRGWDVGMGVSQYYRHDEDQLGADAERVVTFSALLTDVDLSIAHSSNRFDTLGRIAVSHVYDLMDAGRRDQSRYSYAYFDMHDAQKNWSMRIGRQTLHNWGVLGRFDGAHFTYEWAPNRRVHYTTGYPVESTRDSVATSRRFHGAAVDFDHLVGDWDFSVFVNEQTIEGISDRRAAGLEVRYMDDRRTFTSLLDYELGYGEINTALMLATWRLPNRLLLSASFDTRMSPVLTTRNALIGQPVTTIDELLLVWTEDEVRQLAVDRTSHSSTATVGITRPIGQRFQLNADVTTTEYEATVESGGVAAVPGTGRQVYYSTSFIGSSLFGSGDVTILTLRQGQSPSFETSQLTWDARFPIGHTVRLNPRVSFLTWQGMPGGPTRRTVSPSLRLLVNTRRHVRLEAEVGANRLVRTDVNGELQSTGYFFNLGYRAGF